LPTKGYFPWPPETECHGSGANLEKQKNINTIKKLTIFPFIATNELLPLTLIILPPVV
jgi:hypothetical protein